MLTCSNVQMTRRRPPRTPTSWAALQKGTHSPQEKPCSSCDAPVCRNSEVASEFCSEDSATRRRREAEERLTNREEEVTGNQSLYHLNHKCSTYFSHFMSRSKLIERLQKLTLSERTALLLYMLSTHADKKASNPSPFSA